MRDEPARVRGCARSLLHPSCRRRLAVAILAFVTCAAARADVDTTAIVWSWTFESTPGQRDVRAVRLAPDIDGDGVRDVLVAAQDRVLRALSGAVTHEGVPIELWAVEAFEGSGTGHHAVSLAPDHDRDGIEDVLYATGGTDGAVRLVSGADGALLWTYPVRLAGCPQGSDVHHAESVGDLDGDRVPDVAAAVGAPCASVLALSGALSPSERLLWKHGYADGAVAVAAAGNVVGDRSPDVVVAVGETGVYGAVSMLDGQPSYPFRERWWYGGGTVLHRDVLAIPDISGDDRNDVVSASESWFVHAHWGMATGRIEQTIWSRSTAAPVSRIVRVPDTDGDCFDDVLVGGESERVHLVSGLSGALLWTSDPLANAGSRSPAVDAIPDITGDHVWDVAVGTHDDGRVFAVDGSDGTIIWRFDVSNQDILDVSRGDDFDGDGYADVIAGYRGSATALALRGRSGTTCVQPGAEVEGLRVDRLDAERIRITWQAMDDPCHASYRVYRLGSSRTRCFARVEDVTERDEDGDATNTSWTASDDGFGFLVVSVTAGGGLGPLGHFER